MSRRTFENSTADMKSSGDMDRTTNVNFHPLTKPVEEEKYENSDTDRRERL